MFAPTVVLRVRPETRDLLKALAAGRSTTAIDALDDIVRRAYEEQLVAAMCAGAAQGAGPELGDWDALAGDGLEQVDG